MKFLKTWSELGGRPAWLVPLSGGSVTSNLNLGNLILTAALSTGLGQEGFAVVILLTEFFHFSESLPTIISQFCQMILGVISSCRIDTYTVTNHCNLDVQGTHSSSPVYGTKCKPPPPHGNVFRTRPGPRPQPKNRVIGGGVSNNLINGGRVGCMMIYEIIIITDEEVSLSEN